jgi:hypothetical protein
MTRTRLPNRRQCEAVSFEHGGIAYIGWISRSESGAIAECFLDAVSVKATSPISFIAHSLAITASIALQHGATADELRHGLPRVDIPGSDKSEAADPLGKLLEIVSAQQEG